MAELSRAWDAVSQFKTPKKILVVDPDLYTIKLRFSDGLVGTVQLGYIFSKPKALAAEIVKGQMFEKCYIESGALAWPNGLELCPDALRLQIQRIKAKPRPKAA